MTENQESSVSRNPARSPALALAAASDFAVYFLAIRTAFLLLPRFFRVRWRPILVLQLISFLGSQYFLMTEEIMSRRQSEDLGILATTAGLSISFDLILHSAFFAVVIKTLMTLDQKGAPFDFMQTLRQSMNSLLIENMRVLARVIFWLPFMALPALYQYLRLSLVSFIVIEDARYSDGQMDALQRSRELTRGHLPLAVAAVLLAFTFEPLVSSTLTAIISAGEIAAWRSPLGALTSFLSALLLHTWSVIFIFFVYRSLKEKTC